MELYLTYCSKKKHAGCLPPDKLYNSIRIIHFLKYCEDHSFNWAILSAKHGLFFPEESKEPYDVTLKPDSECWLGVRVYINGKRLQKLESNLELKALVEKMSEKVRKRSIKKIYFYQKIPKNIKCYLAILHYVLNGCEKIHSEAEILDCIDKSGKIKIINRLNSITI